jgi:DNA sulfur modification protein DndE
MKQKIKFVMLVTTVIFATSCNLSHNNDKTTMGMNKDSVSSLARQAYVYGYPLVLMHEMMRTFTNVEAPVYGSVNAPVNQFGHFRSFPDATFKNVVRPNCDTYYSCAWLDLKNEPLVLTVPNTNGRYYLLPMLDAYTYVFASPGKRTTGTAAGNFLISSPSFTRNVPAGMSQIKAPTNMVWILGRTQVNTARDGEEIVHKIQDGYTLTPLSKWGTNYVPEKHVIDTTIGKIPPPAVVAKMDIETFFNELNQLMADNPPAKADSVIINKIAAIGIGAGKKFNLADFDTATQSILKTLPALIISELRVAAVTKFGVMENGWNIARTDMGSYGTNYFLRAMVNLIGPGMNLNADACYPLCLIDENGEKLTGTKKYLIHFEKGQTPPANAFWSITMYNSDELLVANPINRFAIGDRDKLKYNNDGSLDIYIQNERPAKVKESNWLPAAKEGFSLTMRLYWPKEEFLNGSWKIPPVEVVN